MICQILHIGYILEVVNRQISQLMTSHLHTVIEETNHVVTLRILQTLNLRHRLRAYTIHQNVLALIVTSLLVANNVVRQNHKDANRHQCSHRTQDIEKQRSPDIHTAQQCWIDKSDCKSHHHTLSYCGYSQLPQLTQS